MKCELESGKSIPIGFLSRCAAIAVVLMAGLAEGCASFNHTSSSCCCCGDQLYCGWRDYVWAKRAYHHRHAICGDAYPTHFRDGFMAGYMAICHGEDGYAPATPPKSYWGYAYQSAEGQAMTGSWFAGYPEGVRAAQEDGAGKYRDLRVSAMLDAAMQPQPDATIPGWDSIPATQVDGEMLGVSTAEAVEVSPVPTTRFDEPVPTGGALGLPTPSRSVPETRPQPVEGPPLAAQPLPMPWTMQR
jgi:hypothetical protein